MQKPRILSLIILFTSLISYAITEKKPWTFLVYMAAANDLNEYALYDLQEMMSVGSNENINIIVYLTIQETGQPKQTKKLYIEKNKITQIGPVINRDSGDIATLVEALQWACLDYPSDNIVVDLWNHGSGPLNRTILPSKGICYDDDTGHYLTDRDCLNALNWIKDIIRDGKNFNIVTCDACLLASVEMAYTFSSCADYFVASQETIPANGFQYATLLQNLSLKNYDPLSCAKLIVSTYEKEYTGTDNYTMSLVDLHALPLLVDNINAVSQILTSHLKSKNSTTAKNIIKKCVALNNCISFSNGLYVDVVSFYKNLLKQIPSLKLPKSLTGQFKQLLSTGISLFGQIVLANVASKQYKQVGGLSIYFSRSVIDNSYYGLYWTKQQPNWLSFLEAYIKGSV